MKGVWHLAWRYLCFHKYKTLVLVASIGLIVFIPTGLNVLVKKGSEQLTARAEQTPLMLGRVGSPLELVLNGLYFQSDTPPPLNFGDYLAIKDMDMGQVIPLHTGFRSRGFPIIGTRLSYFSFRHLALQEGRWLGFLGEAVIGASVAKETGLQVGDTIISAPETAFNLAGAYPLKMTIVGVVGKTSTPDDDAILVDLKTSWVMEGLGHGHTDLSKDDASGFILNQNGNSITANAAVNQFQEITPENISSFHFHGNNGTYPLHAVIVIPKDQKHSAILQGRYQSHAALQLQDPASIIGKLLETVFSVRQYVLIGAFLMVLSAGAMSVLVFMLSQQLRAHELVAMKKIGAAKSFVVGMVTCEIVMVLVSGVLLGMILTLLSEKYGLVFLQSIIVSGV